MIVVTLGLLAGVAGITGFASPGLTGPADGPFPDCTPYAKEWEHPTLNLIFETSTCDWSSTSDKIFGRFYNGEGRPLAIEGRVWTSEPLNCRRGANEVMYFYQTISSGGYSTSDFTIQPRGRTFWVCATLQP
jgi:hypothetical protein